MRRFVQLLSVLMFLACCFPLLTLAEGDLPFFFEVTDEETPASDAVEQPFFTFVEADDDFPFEPVAEEEPKQAPTPDDDEASVVEITDAFEDIFEENPEEEAEKEELLVEIAMESRYAMANQRTFSFLLTVQGGSAPYSAVIRLSANGKTQAEESYGLEEEGVYAFEYMPEVFGTYRIHVSVQDQENGQGEDAAEIPVSTYMYETAEDWEQTFDGVSLSGDWGKDLVKIAKTQIGYQESQYNFIISKSGVKHGYTRYGDWYGSAYSNWCAMFVSFCMHYAEIPSNVVPYDASCSSWAKKFQKLGVFRTDDYTPRAGDLIFFGDAEHVGIVSKVTDDTVVTIEGNKEKSVLRQAYALWDGSIAGYASMRALMDLADGK